MKSKYAMEQKWKITLLIINCIYLAIMYLLIFYVYDWEVMEKWTYIFTSAIFILDMAVWIFSNKQPKQTKTHQNMQYKNLHAWIDEEKYAEVFLILDEHYEKMTDKTTYNRLKKEYKQGHKDIDYEGRVRTFVNDLKKIIPETEEAQNSTNQPTSEKGARIIHTQTYIEKIDKIENFNIDQSSKDKKEE